MTNRLTTKLPKYVSRREYGEFRFKRNIPKDLVELVGKRHFDTVLGKNYTEAMKLYGKALSDFDALIGSYRNETPVREAVLTLVKDKFGEDASLRLGSW